MSHMYDWRARWTGAAGQLDRVFGRTLFRSRFTLDDLPRTPAEIRVSADSSYVLHVNGIEVARGPERMQPRRRTHDRIVIGEHLRPGKNVIACIVTFYASSNAIWQSSAPSGRLGSQAALLLDGQIGDVRLGDVLTWRAKGSPAWQTLPGAQLEGVPSTCFDARELDPDWTAVDFDDADWSPTVEVGAGHRLHLASGAPPAAPFGPVPQRTSPMLTETRRHPTVRARTTNPPVDAETTHPAIRAGRLADLAFPDDSVISGVSVESGEAAVFRLDFGRVVTGVLGFELDAPEGSVVDIAFLERPDGFDEGPLASVSGARYIARGHRDAFSTVERYGMRSAFVLVVPPAGFSGEIAVADAVLRERVRPWTTAVSFETDDAELTALWNAGIRTTALNTVEGFTDCPTREQRAWVGDGVIHAGVHLVANEDPGAVREYLLQADSPRSDGILPMSVAGDLEARDGVTIPSWSLHWVHALHDFFLHQGIDAITRHLPTARRILDWFAVRRDDAGLLGRTGEWDLVDWSSVYVAEESAVTTALWGRALDEYAAMTSAAGDDRSASWARSLAHRAASSFERFWDPQRGLYVDYLSPGAEISGIPVSQASNAAAIVAGFVPDDRRDVIVERMSDPSNLVVSSMYAGPDGRVDLERWERISRGVRVIDWDPAKVVRAEPFFSAVVHDAYRCAGRDDLVLRAIRDWLPFLDGGRDTFGETWRWGTTCHGWSSTPTRDIARSLLGISPASPGFGSARVAPWITDGCYRGGVPTPHGPLSVAVGADAVEVSSPVPFEYADAGSHAPGVHRFPRDAR